MPSNPFDAFFEPPGGTGEKKDQQAEREEIYPPIEDRTIFPEDGKESLDEILEKNNQFEQRAAGFSKLLLKPVQLTMNP